MPGARHWIVAGTIVVLLSGLAPGAPLAQDAKLLANCAAPQRVAGSADASPGASPAVEATVSCEMRSTDAVVFKGVKASVKGRSEPLEVDFKAFDAGSNSLTGMFLRDRWSQNASQRQAWLKEYPVVRSTSDHPRLRLYGQDLRVAQTGERKRGFGNSDNRLPAYSVPENFADSKKWLLERFPV